MPDVPDNSIDMILSDLPYGVTKNTWDTPIPLQDLWSQYKRICKRNAAILLMATQPFASTLIDSNPNMFRYDWIWEKDKAVGYLNANRMPLRKHEYVLVFYESLPTYNPQMVEGAPCHSIGDAKGRPDTTTNYGFRIRDETIGTLKYPTSIIKFNKDTGLHPTQKPAALFEYLIRTYTNEGDIVLDNCIGSGTTAIACMKSNRRFIGIEKNPDIFDLARRRIQIERDAKGVTV